ncbi:MAG: RsmB/NOP family class I SAM-dependent RNA methyltransferase [Promethearchaeota archaeon]
MIERYLDFLGLDETIKLLEANEEPLIPTIRVNTLKISQDKLRTRLEKKGFKLEPIIEIPCGFKVIKKTSNLGSLHEFLQGYYYLQNKASMLPPLILNPQSNEVVIDMCAAPGSKSTHLAQIMNNQGKLILIEKKKERISALKMNLRRMGIFNSVVLHSDAVNISHFKIKPDKILLDAPCTGEGLIKTDPNRKKSKTMKDIEKMASLQTKLLNAGLDAMHSGGLMLYCTCSIAPEENELVINKILQENSDISIKKLSNQYGIEGLTKVYGKKLNKSLNLTQRIYPHIHETIGFFLCLLEKS